MAFVLAAAVGLLAALGHRRDRRAPGGRPAGRGPGPAAALRGRRQPRTADADRPGAHPGPAAGPPVPRRRRAGPGRPRPPGRHHPAARRDRGRAAAVGPALRRPGRPAGRAPVDLVALAAAAVATETERAAERDVRVALVAPDEAVPVPGIESALRRVVAELLANALHTPRPAAGSRSPDRRPGPGRAGGGRHRGRVRPGRRRPAVRPVPPGGRGGRPPVRARARPAARGGHRPRRDDHRRRASGPGATFTVRLPSARPVPERRPAGRSGGDSVFLGR